jgi:hypothetical protein
VHKWNGVGAQGALGGGSSRKKPAGGAVGAPKKSSGDLNGSVKSQLSASMSDTQLLQSMQAA